MRRHPAVSTRPVACEAEKRGRTCAAISPQNACGCSTLRAYIALYSSSDLTCAAAAKSAGGGKTASGSCSSAIPSAWRGCARKNPAHDSLLFLTPSSSFFFSKKNKRERSKKSSKPIDLCPTPETMACLDDSPDPNDPRFQYQNEWHTGMMGAPCANPLCFLGSVFCPVCSACYVRRQSLEEDMSRYSCCQGYYDCMCFKAGSLGESSCPDVYNLLESCEYACARRDTGALKRQICWVDLSVVSTSQGCAFRARFLRRACW